MTSNQIAFASEQEAERSNRAVETETNRHNLAMEELQDRSLDLEQQKVAINAEMTQRKLELDKYIADQNREVQQGLLDAEVAKVNIAQQREQYQELLDLNKIFIDNLTTKLKQDTLNEDVRHNEVVESIQQSQIDFENARLRFDKYKFDEQMQLSTKELNVKAFSALSNAVYQDREQSYKRWAKTLDWQDNGFLLQTERQKVEILGKNADVNVFNAETQRQMLEETQRHNYSQEMIEFQTMANDALYNLGKIGAQLAPVLMGVY